MTTSGSWNDDDLEEALEKNGRLVDKTSILPNLETENAMNKKGDDGNWLDTMGVKVVHQRKTML